MEENPYEAPKIEGDKPKDEWFIFKRTVDLIFILFVVLVLTALLLPAVRPGIFPWGP
jgi:hypothetical protein